jgi:hypothetical protein
MLDASLFIRSNKRDANAQSYERISAICFIKGAAYFIFSSCLLLACLTKTPEVQASEQELDQPTLAWMQAVFDNWERVCRRDLHVSAEPLPWIIFYDESRAWHLKPEERLLPSHKASSVSLRFAGRTYTLILVAHQDGRLWVPGRKALKIDSALPQVAAMPYDNDQKPFFIAPLPALYHRLAGADQTSNLDELFLGITAHELTHTRHLVYGVQQIKRLRARYQLAESLDDNIIERDFGRNDEYKKTYDEERKLLTSAIMAGDLEDCFRKVEQVLSSAQKRKVRFFVGDKAGYSDLEDIFLAMEGMAMWVQYRTARERGPAGEDWLKTLIKLSERTDAWSQEEGLGLFLLIDGLVPDWQRRFLAPDFPSPFAVLREAIAKRPPRKSATKLWRKRGERDF